MKKRVDKIKNKDLFYLFVLFAGFFISLNVIGGTFFQILGVAFLLGLLYGIVSLYKTGRFIC